MPDALRTDFTARALTADGSIGFVDHDETDVLLWMTTPEGEDAGPFDSTMKLWKACLNRLAGRGYVELGDKPLTAEVTPEGEAYAAELRASRAVA